MKRVAIMVLLVAVTAAIWSGGKAESPTGVINLTVAGGRSPVFDKAITNFQVANPTVRIRWLTLSFADGSTVAQDAMIAAGIYPNILMEFAGRLSKLAVRDPRPGAWQAQDLKGYLETNQLIGLDSYWRNGMLLMAPQTSPAQAMVINLDLIEKAGYVLPAPEAWTVDEFKKMCAAVKAKVPGAWGTVMFGKNQSADYLWMNWFSSFGYKSLYNAEHTKSALAGSEAVWQFFADVVKNGWAPPEAAELWDDAALEIWQHGTVAAMGIRPDWIAGYMQGGVDNKWIAKPFRVVMYQFPKTTIPTQTVGAGNALVSCETGDPRIDAMAGKLSAYFLSKEIVTEMSVTGKDPFPVRKDVVGYQPKPEEKQWYDTTGSIIKSVGYLDVGYTLAKYADIRAEGFPLLQGLWTGKITAKQAAETYAAKIDAALAQ